MGPNQTIEERDRAAEQWRREQTRERERREFKARTAPPPAHFVEAAHQILAGQHTEPESPVPIGTVDEVGTSLARMRNATALPAAPASLAPTPAGESLARMQAATGLPRT